MFFVACALFSLLFSQVIFSEPLGIVAKKICDAAGKLKNKQIAVLPFPYHDGGTSSDSTIISEKLITKIVGKNKFQVVERSLLEKVIGELKLQNSGMISQESAKKIGNILGVEAILTGTLIDLGEGSIEINARLIHTETGLVLAAANDQIQRTWEKESVRPAEPVPDQEVKEKMSVFFNSREWKDPRFEGSEGGSSRSQPAPAAGTAVLSNADETANSALGGDEKILDGPAELMKALQVREGEKESEEYLQILKVWEDSKRQGPEQGAKNFAHLKEQFEANPRFASLAQLYLAENKFKYGRFQEALTQARQAAKSVDSPRLKAQAMYVMARSQEELGRFGIAAGLYREILQNHPYEARLIRAAGYRMRAHARRRP